METQICRKCGIEKSLDNFNFITDTKKYAKICKKCKSEYDKEYRKKNKKRIIKRDEARRHTLKYKQYQKEYSKKYYQKNKEKLKKYQAYYRNNNSKRKEYEKNYRKINEQKIKNYSKTYALMHKEEKRIKDKTYRLEHRNEITQRKKEKLKNDPILSFKSRIRNNIRQSFERQKQVKNNKLEEICGCSIDMLIEHLIKTYETNYNTKWDWKFVQEVHIDHKMPLVTAKTEEDVIKLCHYTNLQLLKARDNLKKGSKIFDI